MIVVSQFDGCSSGLQVLKEMNIHVSEYHAFEIDPYAIQVSEKNHPEIIRHGDVNYWHEADIDWMNVDLILAGSPCQGFSFAGKQLAFDDPRSALFFKWVELVNFMKLLKGDKCVFMLENVDMKQKYRDVITERLGVEPVFINSKIHSPQSRPRWYWSNRKITEPCEVYSPLSSILELDPPRSTLMSKKFRTRNAGMKCFIDASKDKFSCLSALEYVKNGRQGDYLQCDSEGSVQLSSGRIVGRRINPETGRREDNNKNIPIMQVWEPCGDDKSGCLTTVLKDTMLGDDEVCYRKPTPVECERLQGLPDNYTEGVSDTQRYKMIGNGWQLTTIRHIFEDILYDSQSHRVHRG